MKYSLSSLYLALAIVSLSSMPGCGAANLFDAPQVSLDKIGNAGSQRIRRAVGAYLEKRWTVERLVQYCRPETRQLPGIQSLSFKPNVVSGDLFAKSEPACGKVSFCAEVEGGRLARYEVNIFKDKDSSWRISEEYERGSELSDGDLKKMIVFRVLKQSLAAYAVVHKNDKAEMEKVSHLYLMSADTFQPGVDGSDNQFEGTLYSGKKLFVACDDKFNIHCLTVDAVDVPLFSQALCEANHNIDQAWKMSRRDPPVKKPPEKARPLKDGTEPNSQTTPQVTLPIPEIVQPGQ